MEAKSKRITIRLTDGEYEELQKKCREAKVNQTTFIRSAISGKEIFVIDGFKEFTVQLSRIGNNINQLTVLAHQRVIKEVNLDKAISELGGIWKEVNKLRKNLREKN